jgi:hypothetical protein
MRNKKMILGVIAALLVAMAAAIFLPPLGKRCREARERARVEKIKGFLRKDIAFLNENYRDEKNQAEQWDRYCNPMFAPLFAYQPTGQGFWTSWMTMGKMLMKVQPQGYEERRCLYEGLDAFNTAWWKYGGPERGLVASEDEVWFFPDKKDAVVGNFYQALEKRRVDILETLPSSGD